MEKPEKKEEMTYNSIPKQVCANINQITTISFDADGTLWDFEKVMHHALGCALTELRRLVSSTPETLSIQALIDIRNQVAQERRGEVTTHEAMRLEGFKRIVEFIGMPDEELAAHLSSVYLKHRFEDIQLYDDVLPALDALQQHYTLGIISNGNTYPDRCGLPGWFEFVVFSQDYGVEKPDPQLFEIALEQAGCANRQMLHVGDSLETDVMGAKRVGAWSGWLNREAHVNDAGIQPDMEIRSLTTLVEICNAD